MATGAHALDFEKLASVALDALASGSDTLVAAALGSLFTVIGVFLTNRHNQRSLKAQHAHDEEMRKREYQLNVRRDVYLGAAEAINELLSALMNLAVLHKGNDEIFALSTSKQGALARTYLVSTDDTTMGLLQFIEQYNRSVAELMIQRIPLLAKRDRMLERKRAGNHAQERRDEYLQHMRTMNLNGERDDRKWAHIQQSFQFEQDQATKAYEAHDVIMGELRQDHLKFFQSCNSEAQTLRKMLMPILVSVRKELEVPTDFSKFEGLVLRSASLSDAQLKQLFDPESV